MRLPVRRVLGVLMALIGFAVAVLGTWVAVKLGPSGEARFSATSRATGAVVVDPDVLNVLDLPVRVTATRADGGALWLATAARADAHAALASAAVSTVGQVHYPAGTLALRSSGSGTLPDVSTADVWRLTAERAGSAELLVGQGVGPETVVVTSGDATALKDVTLTLAWADRSWFFETLAAAVIGAIMAAFAIGALLHGRLESSGRGSLSTEGPGVTA